MPFQHTNRKGKTYYLHQGTTKTGKPKYYFSMKTDGDLVDEIPPGYEIYENPNAQVFLRKIQPKLIADEEKELIEKHVEANPDVKHFLVEIKKRQIIIHTSDQNAERLMKSLESAFGRSRASVEKAILNELSYSPLMRFDLDHAEERTFVAMRYCFSGSIDDWIYIGGPDKLLALAEEFVPHLEKESFFELY